MGPPENADTNMGALVSKQHLDKVRSYVKYALEDGGAILCGETVNEPLQLPDTHKV